MSASNVRVTIFEFGCFRLDVQERTLCANGKPVSLTPRVFDLLVLLVQNPGKLLEKDWLLNTMWPGTFVEEANLSVNISTLRRALESAGGAHYIETVPKRGYRFVGEVQEKSPILPLNAALNVETTEAPPSTATAPRLAHMTRHWADIALALIGICLLCLVLTRCSGSPGQVRSIAVLPFRPLIATEEKRTDDNYLGPGVSDAIIRKLSATHQVAVRGTFAVQKFQLANVDPIAAARELKVDVVLDGTIQHAGNAIRVSVQLLRVSDGTAVWADHFDDDCTNIFQMQDSLSEKIVSELKMKLTESAQHQKNPYASHLPSICKECPAMKLVLSRSRSDAASATSAGNELIL